ncbi:MAG TPA: hypothetical protein VIC08_04030, partial [Cellvibrionaceae bacterium]
PVAEEVKAVAESEISIDTTKPNKTVGRNIYESLAEQSFSQEDAYQVQQWLDERGHFGVGGDLDYQDYSWDTLDSLAKQGDMRAMQQLADRAANDGDFSLAKGLYLSAAVRGSTLALVRAANLTGVAVISGEVNHNEVMRSHALEALSLYAVAERRSDYMGAVQFQARKEIWGIELSESEMADIQQRADELYQTLSQSRRDLGLAPFDNNLPDAVQDFYLHITQTAGP